MAGPGKFGSSAFWFLVQGYNMISNKLQGATWKISPLQESTHGLGDSWEESTPTGVSVVEVTQEGAYFDTQTGFIHDAKAGVPGALTPQSVGRVACLGPEGHVIGASFLGLSGVWDQAYEVIDNVGALDRANVAYKVTGVVELGVILHLLTVTETADVLGAEAANSVDNTTVPQDVVPITSSTVANPTTITTPVPHGLTTGDTILIAGHSGSTPSLNGVQTVTVVTSTTFTIPVNETAGPGSGGTFTRAGTSNGGSAYINWTNLVLAGYTNALVTVRHSTDNSTFVDLVSMTAATVIRGAERKTVAGTVRRYLAQNLDLTGAGGPAAFNYMLGFARNP